MSERVKVKRIMDVLSAADTGKLVFNDENAVMVVSACGSSDNRVTFTCDVDQARRLLGGKVRVTIEEVRDDD